MLAKATAKAMNGGTVVICGPSGAGKSTFLKRLLAKYDNFGFSVSHTTRNPRDGEVDGKHYHFVPKEEFKQMIAKDEFVEWAEVHGNFYGSSWRAVTDLTSQGKICLMDIDLVGAASIRQRGVPAKFIFVQPPSLAILEQRLVSRGTESDETLRTRLVNAGKEMEQMKEAPHSWDNVVINDDVDIAYVEFEKAMTRYMLSFQDGEGFKRTVSTASTAASEEGDCIEKEVVADAEPATPDTQTSALGGILAGA